MLDGGIASHTHTSSFSSYNYVDVALDVSSVGRTLELLRIKKKLRVLEKKEQKVHSPSKSHSNVQKRHEKMTNFACGRVIFYSKNLVARHKNCISPHTIIRRRTCIVISSQKKDRKETPTRLWRIISISCGGLIFLLANVQNSYMLWMQKEELKSSSLLTNSKTEKLLCIKWIRTS